MFNKEKIKVTEENYKEIVLKRAIIVCWVILGICLVIKLFGGDFFNIVCKEENFIKVCDFIDKTFLRYIIYAVEFLITNYLLMFIVDGGFKIKSIKSLIYAIVSLCIWCVKLLCELNIISISTLLRNILEFVCLYLLLIIFSRRYIKSILCCVLLFVFSFISSYVKSIGIDSSVTDYFLISQIFAIDYYIMLLLTALYSRLLFIKKEKKKWD